MARSIILRFDATCHDCGNSLPAGSKARWFGRGRVSCCGNDINSRAPAREKLKPDVADLLDPRKPTVTGTVDGGPATPFNTANINGEDVKVPIELPAAASPEVRKFIGDTREELDRASAEEPAAMTIARIGQLAETRPNCLLLVRLRDGARFLVPARDAVHVTRCIVESLMDSIRDITVSPKQ